MTTGRPSLGRPAIAAITFSPHGGGIAAVSRLVRLALGDAAGSNVDALSLAADARRFDTSTARRVAFGLGIGWVQASRRYDWLLYTHRNLLAIQARIPRALARPYAVFLHDVEAWTPLDRSTTRVLAGAFLRLANSRYTADRAAAANPGIGPIVPCPLALPPRQGRPVASTGKVVSGPRSVLIVGRMAASDRYKGHDQLIEAWPRVLRQMPDATLVCVGEGDDVSRLRQKAEQAGVGRAVTFTGFVDEPTRASLYEEATLLAMPSRREGFGLVYVEAMAAGLPCIGSIHDAASDVIVDGETGYLVDQSDTAGLADRIVAVLGDETLRQRLGAAGRARYERQFTYDAFKERLVSAVTAALPLSSAEQARRQQPEVV